MASGYPDFEGGKTKLHTVADWAAVEATDKNFRSVGTNQSFGDVTTNSYVVPTGKILYITQFSVSALASAVADGDSNQMCYGSLTELMGVGVQFTLNGNGGASIVFNKPLVFRAGYTAQFSVVHHANHDCTVEVCAGGYEV